MSPRSKTPAPPALGATMDRWHRYIWRDETGEYGPLTSVTTTLQTIPKPAIARAATRITAENVFDLYGRGLDEILTLPRERAIEELGGYVWNMWRASADFGTAAHNAIQKWVESRGTVIPEGADERAFLRAYRQFTIDEGVRPDDVHHVEGRVFNLTHLFAGTFDQDVTLRGKRTLLDVKTGNDTYDETQLQLAGYDECEFMGRPGDATRYPMPPWEQYAVLHVRPEGFEGGHERGYELTFYDITPVDRETFVHAVYVRRWALEKERQYRERQKEAKAS